MLNNYIGERDSVAFNKVINKMREFFLGRGFTEVHSQDRLSILAACEDPETVATYNYNHELWPLPQTGQMWLEYELLTKPELSGVFCVSTSYRQEPNPVPGRHKLIFPMFEFEGRGNLEDLRKMEADLLAHLGFKADNFCRKDYDELRQVYKTEELKHDHERAMQKDFGEVVFLERFPVETSPFWNMKKESDTHSKKIDVIVGGQETIGSAERSTNKAEMREEFYTISNGGYAGKLFELFGKERVERELNDYLALEFFPRFGGGIGVSRMIEAMKGNSLV